MRRPFVGKHRNMRSFSLKLKLPEDKAEVSAAHCFQDSEQVLSDYSATTCSTYIITCNTDRVWDSTSIHDHLRIPSVEGRKNELRYAKLYGESSDEEYKVLLTYL